MQIRVCSDLQASRSQLLETSPSALPIRRVTFASWIHLFAFVSAFLFAAASGAFAQGPQVSIPPGRAIEPIPEVQPQRQFSLINVGVFAGRSGAANGPSGFVEFDPIRWFGLGVFASESSGAQDMYGGRAYGWSFTGGLSFSFHPPTVKGFRISPFAQVGFNHDHGRLIIPLGIPGMYWKDGDNPERYTWTVGPSIERPLFKNGPWWSVHLGKNFGPVTSAQYGGGLYAVGGFVLPMDHPIELAKSFRRF